MEIINIAIDPIVREQTQKHYKIWRRQRILKTTCSKTTIRTCNTCRNKFDSLTEDVYKRSFIGVKKTYTTYMCKQCYETYKGKFRFSLIFEEPFYWLDDD